MTVTEAEEVTETEAEAEVVVGEYNINELLYMVSNVKKKPNKGEKMKIINLMDYWNFEIDQILETY